MKTLLVYDPAMCCSTGVCGPQVDPALARFAADLKWLGEQRVSVQRHNLSQDPAAFVQNEAVKTLLQEKAEAALPIVIADGRVIATGRYPGRDELCRALGLVDIFIPKRAVSSGDCCGGKC